MTVTPPRSKAVIVTGASSGLGRAAVLRLAELGYRVFAGVRTQSSADELAEIPSTTGELIPTMLDVTDTDSIERAARLVERRSEGTGLWAVVNNAGIAVSSPLECVPLEIMRSQLETNVIGAVAMLQRFLPLLRASHGRIINVSSGIANVAPPYLGAYAAAQFAKEGLSDALRRELRPLGVQVSVIQPGTVFTPIWDKMHRTAEGILEAAPADTVGLYRDRFIEFLDRSESLAKVSTTSTSDFARVVATALAAKRPRARYHVGFDSWAGALARRVMTEQAMDALITIGIKASTKTRVSASVLRS